MVAPGVVSSLWLLYPISVANNKLLYVLSGICDSLLNLLRVTWLLLMSILAESAPNLANSLVVCEFGCAIFQTLDAMMS